jgi:uncharacterized protein (TIGR02466 family)
MELFSTPVWLFNCREDFKKSIKNHIGTIKKLRNSGEGIEGDYKSGRNGWRLTEINLRNEFEEINKEIIYNLGGVIADKKIFDGKKQYNYSIESWVNLNDKGGYNKVHHHGMFSLSGVMYLKCPKDSGRLLLKDPRPAVYFNNSLIKNAGEEIVIQPEEGLIVFFPGFLEHSVEQNNSNQTRISISFNINLSPQ